MLYYVLNKNLDGNKIIKDIIQIIQKVPDNEKSNTVLIISLQKTTTYANTVSVLNIEYKQPES